ncbi:MAG TPA: GNAT family N-acetyltransferase [Spirillospora sp.]
MSTEISDNAAENRYEIKVDGDLAGFVVYERRGSEVVLVHTEVAPAFEGKGVGGSLARGVLDDLRAKNLSVVPLCPFIKGWIDRHPDYQDLVVS